MKTRTTPRNLNALLAALLLAASLVAPGATADDLPPPPPREIELPERPQDPPPIEPNPQPIDPVWERPHLPDCLGSGPGVGAMSEPSVATPESVCGAAVPAPPECLAEDKCVPEEINVPDNDPCLLDPLACTFKKLNELEGCSDLTYLGELAVHPNGSVAHIYAKRVAKHIIRVPNIPPSGFNLDPNSFVASLNQYDIYVTWSLGAASLVGIVGATEHPIGFAVQWGSQHSLLVEKNRQSGTCEFVGRVTGNQFLGSVKGGAAGSITTQQCEWSISASYSVSAGVEVKAGPVPGASGSLTTTTTLGTQAGCSNGGTFASEVLLLNTNQAFTIPPWA